MSQLIWPSRIVQMYSRWQAIIREDSRLQNTSFKSCNLKLSRLEVLTFFELLANKCWRWPYVLHAANDLSALKLIFLYLWASMTNNTSGRLCDLALMRIESDESERLKSWTTLLPCKHAKCFLNSHFRVYWQENSGYSYVSMKLCVFEHKWRMNFLKQFVVQFKSNVFHFKRNCCLQYVIWFFLQDIQFWHAALCRPL